LHHFIVRKENLSARSGTASSSRPAKLIRGVKPVTAFQ
jgi:hypothetical protein